VTDRPEPSAPPGRLARLARLAYRRRRLMVASWVAALVAVIALAPMLAGDFSQDYAVPDSDSREARELIAERFDDVSAESVDVVWEAQAGARSPAVRAEMNEFLADAERLEGITGRHAGPGLRGRHDRRQQATARPPGLRGPGRDR